MHQFTGWYICVTKPQCVTGWTPLTDQSSDVIFLLQIIDLCLSQVIPLYSITCHIFVCLSEVICCVSVTNHTLWFCHMPYIYHAYVCRRLHIYISAKYLTIYDDACHLISPIYDLQFQYISYFSKHCFQMHISKHPFVEYSTWDPTSLPSNPCYLDSYIRNVLHRKVLNFENLIL